MNKLVASALKSEIRKHKILQTEMADALGMSPQVLSRVLNSLNNVDYEILMRIKVYIEANKAGSK